MISTLAPLILGVVVSSTGEGVCLESSAPGDGVVRLQRQADRIGLRLSVRPSCEGSTGFRARIEVRGAELILLMRAPNGGVASRQLPWTGNVGDGVAMLDARGRLSALALLLAGLAADVQLLTPQRKRPAPTRSQRIDTGRLPAGQSQQRPSPVRTDAVTAKPHTTQREDAAPRDQERTARVPPTTSSATPGVRSSADAARGHAVSAHQEGGRNDRASSHHEVPAAAPPSPGSPMASSLQRAGEGTEAAPPLAVAPARPTAQTRGRTAPSSWWQRSRFELIGTARWRSPSIIAQQLAVRGRAGPLFAELDMQLPAQWTLEARRIDVRAAGARAGVLQPFVARPVWSLHGLLAAGGQRLEVRRLDVNGARAHAFWDLELSAGISAERAVGSQVQLGVAMEFVWAPTAHNVVVPEGPSARFNAVGARAGLSVSWGPQMQSDQPAAMTTDPQEDGRHEPPARL